MPWRRLIWIVVSTLLHLGSIERAAADGAIVQFCWALGALDQAVYFAESESPDDRRSSFAGLIEISGIDHSDLQCRAMEALSYPAFRDSIFSKWKKNRLEIVNTTFLSDLDY